MVATFREIAHGVKISDPETSRTPFQEVLRARNMQRAAVRRSYSDADFLEGYRFYRGVVKGVIPSYKFEEVMTVSDFPLLFGDILSRELLGNYAAVPVSWPAYMRRGTLADATRQSRRLTYDGLDAHMDEANIKPDATAGLEQAPVEAGYVVGPLKVYERIVSINWKMLLADDLGGFNDIPSRLALAGRRTEEWLAAKTLADSAGPHASYFTSGNGNKLVTANGALTNNPAFSLTNIIEADRVFAGFTNPATGEPIVVDKAVLVLPRQLNIAGKIAFNSIAIESNAAALGGSLTGLANSSGIENRIQMPNWITQDLKYVVNPYLSVINTTNGDTAWYVVSDPNQGRPGFELNFLRGEEAPILLRQTSDAERVGGGNADMFGSFETGEIRFKVMHLLSADQLDPFAAVASEGDGT